MQIQEPEWSNQFSCDVEVYTDTLHIRRDVREIGKTNAYLNHELESYLRMKEIEISPSPPSSSSED